MNDPPLSAEGRLRKMANEGLERLRRERPEEFAMVAPLIGKPLDEVALKVFNDRGESYSLRSTPAPDAIAVGVPEPRWRAHELLPEVGVALSAGKPKMGKSTVMRSALFSIVTGGNFVGRPCTPCSVLYVSFEDSDGIIIRHLAKMGGHRAPGYHFVHSRPPTEPWETVIQAIAEEVVRIEAKVVAIDTLGIASGIGDVADYGPMIEVMSPLYTLSADLQALVWVNHHARKASGGDVTDMVLGSTALAATCDTLLAFGRDDGIRWVASRQREGQEIEKTEIVLGPESGLVTIGQSVQDAAMDVMRDRVLNTVRKHAKPRIKRSDLPTLAGARAQTAKLAADLLADEGRLVRHGTGHSGSPIESSMPEEEAA